MMSRARQWFLQRPWVHPRWTVAALVLVLLVLVVVVPMGIWWWSVVLSGSSASSPPSSLHTVAPLSRSALQGSQTAFDQAPSFAAAAYPAEADWAHRARGRATPITESDERAQTRAQVWADRLGLLNVMVLVLPTDSSQGASSCQITWDRQHSLGTVSATAATPDDACHLAQRQALERYPNLAGRAVLKGLPLE